MNCYSCKNKDCLNCKNSKETYSYPFNQYILDGFNPPQPDTSGSDKCTSLPEDDEDRFRKFLYVLFDLSYNEICVLKGIMNGKDITSIAKDIELNAKKNQTVSRHKVFQERKAILKKLGDQFAAALLTNGQRRRLKGE